MYKNVQSSLIQSSHNWEQPKCSLTGDREPSVVGPNDRIYSAVQAIKTTDTHSMCESHKTMLGKGSQEQSNTLCIILFE